MSDFLKDIIKETGNEYAGLVSDGIDSADVTSFIDTGSYSFNALLSGSIYGGMPGNKITAIAGEAATGKTFFALGICKAFLDKDPEAGIVVSGMVNTMWLHSPTSAILSLRTCQYIPCVKSGEILPSLSTFLFAVRLSRRNARWT